MVDRNHDGKAHRYVLALLLGLALATASIAEMGCAKPQSQTPSVESVDVHADTSTPTTKPATTTKPKPAASPKKPPTIKDVTRQPALVLRTGKGGNSDTITLDYVKILTGKAAQDAAVKQGQSPSRTLFVENTNTQLRTIPISPSVAIVLHPTESPKSARQVTLSDFKRIMSAGIEKYGGKHYEWNPTLVYYVDIEKGKVTRIENQWIP